MLALMIKLMDRRLSEKTTRGEACDPNLQLIMVYLRFLIGSLYILSLLFFIKINFKIINYFYKHHKLGPSPSVHRLRIEELMIKSDGQVKAVIMITCSRHRFEFRLELNSIE